ncbi:MAG: hypothetical protein AB7I30_17495 [Isosphaeraceae bacterium]
MTTRHASRRKGRSGITLTEILISIMIMGVGIVSLATLFPLGLIRMRNAQRLTRGAFLLESASSDLASRNLLDQRTFTNVTRSPWYATAFGQYNPWIQDTVTTGNASNPYEWAVVNNGVMTYLGIHRGYGGLNAPNVNAHTVPPSNPGLPVVYDPLWWAVHDSRAYPLPNGGPRFRAVEGRFGSGIGFLRNDPNPGPVGPAPSAHGLQRLSNFCTYRIPIANSPDLVTAEVSFANYNRVLSTFVSPEDLVLQESNGAYIDPNTGTQIASPSTVVPDLSLGGTPMANANNVVVYPPQNDWRFSWMLTGHLEAANDGSKFEGELVVHENRQFGLDTVVGGGLTQPAGETVVEAVYGYSTTAGEIDVPTNIGYGNLSASRTVLLRWPSTQPDPDVRVGGWIADVTYERSEQESFARSYRSNGVKFNHPLQRCHWYQVTKKTEPVLGRPFNGDPANTIYREMTIWVSTRLRALTPLNFNSSPPSPYHVEAALIAPTVVNVYPWSGVIR